MKRGWQIFLKIISFGLKAGALGAKKPQIREGLERGSDLAGGLVEEDQGPTERERPSAKRGRGLR